MINRLSIKNKLGKPGIALLLFLILAEGADSQVVFKTDPASKMTIEGTSNLHDWTSKVTQSSGSAYVMIEQGKITGITRLFLEFPVKAIKSDKALMDNKTYDALKSETNPVITFNLIRIKQLTGKNVSASGTLSIAGKTQNIELAAEIEEIPGNKIMIRGQKSLKMTDFSVEPPSALMGTVKTGDKITARFEMVFTKSDNSEKVTYKR